VNVSNECELINSMSDKENRMDIRDIIPRRILL
jgi:hypothetical protein